MSRASVTSARTVIAARTQRDAQGDHYARLIVGGANGNVLWDGSVWKESTELQEVAAAQLDSTHILVAWRVIGGPIRGAVVTCTP